MTTYNVFPETTIATPHLTPAQAVPGASVVFTGNSPYDFEQAAAVAAGLVVGNTYTIDSVYTSVGNPTISLREMNTIPTDSTGAAVKRPVFDMYMFTISG